MTGNAGQPALPERRFQRHPGYVSDVPKRDPCGSRSGRHELVEPYLLFELLDAGKLGVQLEPAA